MKQRDDQLKALFEEISRKALANKNVETQVEQGHKDLQLLNGNLMETDYKVKQIQGEIEANDKTIDNVSIRHPLRSNYCL